MYRKYCKDIQCKLNGAISELQKHCALYGLVEPYSTVCSLGRSPAASWPLVSGWLGSFCLNPPSVGNRSVCCHAQVLFFHKAGLTLRGKTVTSSFEKHTVTWLARPTSYGISSGFSFPGSDSLYLTSQGWAAGTGEPEPGSLLSMQLCAELSWATLTGDSPKFLNSSRALPSYTPLPRYATLALEDGARRRSPPLIQTHRQTETDSSSFCHL